MDAVSKFCSVCGAPLDEGAHFCGKCGAPVTDSHDISQRETESPQKKSETREENKETPHEKSGYGKYMGLLIASLVLLLFVAGGTYVYFEQENKKEYTIATPLVQTPSKNQGGQITLLGQTYNPNTSVDPKKYTDKAKQIADELERSQGAYSQDQKRKIWNQIIENIQMAISLDDPEAYYLLALIYEDGYGDTRRDLRKMVDNLTLSAQKGYIEAQYILGEMYKDGDEVVKDRSRAIFWLNKAANQGHKDAKFELKYFTN